MLRRSLLVGSSLLRCGRHLKLRNLRRASAWIRAESSNATEEVLDVEKLFTSSDVQRVLRELTGVELEEKVYKTRPIHEQERSHYALMTDQMLKMTVDRMRSDAQYFLQFVPVKEPRSEELKILSNDPEISGFDQSKFVFTDISYDATDKDRVVVVREVDGVLRLGTPEERDRMNRLYFDKPFRPVTEPQLFKDPFLKDSLVRDDHEFLLDWATHFYEPDDPTFVRLCCDVFDRTVADKKFALLYSTRHFGPFAFYLALNGNIPPLLNYFGVVGSLSSAANLIRLHKLIHPSWRTAIGSEDDDRKIVNDYIRQNVELKEQLEDLIALLQGDKVRKSKELSDEQATKKLPEEFAKMATMDKESIRGESGPLGEIAKEYSVKVARSSYDAEESGKDRTEGVPLRAKGTDRDRLPRKLFRPKSKPDSKPKS